MPVTVTPEVDRPVVRRRGGAGGTTAAGTESNLALRIAGQDETAIADAYREFGPMVLGYVRRLLPRDDADEVTQTTFLELWRSADRFDPERPLAAWLLGIARKRAIDRLRRKQPDSVSLDDVAEVADAAGPDLADRYLRAREVRVALARLPGPQKDVLALAYFDGLTQVEIAARLGVPLGTVKARTFRGLRRLRALLEP